MLIRNFLGFSQSGILPSRQLLQPLQLIVVSTKNYNMNEPITWFIELDGRAVMIVYHLSNSFMDLFKTANLVLTVTACCFCISSVSVYQMYGNPLFCGLQLLLTLNTYSNFFIYNNFFIALAVQLGKWLRFLSLRSSLYNFKAKPTNSSLTVIHMPSCLLRTCSVFDGCSTVMSLNFNGRQSLSNFQKSC